MFIFVFAYSLIQTQLLEQTQLSITKPKMNFYKEKQFSAYYSDGIEFESNIKFTKPGRLILNALLLEGVDYALQLSVPTLNANHILCIGIGSQGFIAAEILGLEYTTRSNYQLGLCSDGTNATKFKDTYSDFIEFETAKEEDEFDEGTLLFGTSQEKNLFEEQFYMILRDNQLIFMNMKDEILMTYDNLDRRRTFVPVITMHLRNQVKVKIEKEVCVVVEEFAFVQLVGQFNPFKKERPKQIIEDAIVAKSGDEQEPQPKVDEVHVPVVEQHQQEPQPEPQPVQEQNQEVPEEENEPLIINEEGEHGEANGEDIPGEEQLPTQDAEQEVIPEEIYEEAPPKPNPEDDTTETHFEIKELQSHVITPTQFSNRIIPLRVNMLVEQNFTVYQDNTQLPDLLQDYKSCTYGYLSVRPAAKNFYIQVSIDNIDDLYGSYPVGIGVYAYSMLDRLRGWRNIQNQLWCLDKDSEDLWQYGALYRSDGTFIDSYMLGEYFKYKVDKESKRQTKIHMYFSDGNKLAFTFDDEKTLMLTCVNSKFKHFVPIIELKAFKGVPTVTVLEYQEDVDLPFKYIDNDETLFNTFETNSFDILSTYVIEKRGKFNEDDDDYVLSALESSGSANMWDTLLYEQPREWWIRIDQLSQDPGMQICLGITQAASEGIMERVFLGEYKAQVAMICDQNQIMQTFFQECPLSENTLKLVEGSVIRFRTADYLLQIHDGYNYVYLSLRKSGRTGLIPSVILRADNKVTFLKAPEKFGPNPLDEKVDPDILQFENFASYDIFTVPVLDKAGKGLFKEDKKEPLINPYVKPKKTEPKDIAPPIGRNHQKLEEIKQEDAAEQQQSNEEPKDGTIPEEIPVNEVAKCVIVYEHCNFEGFQAEIYSTASEQAHHQFEQFKSIELCKKTEEVKMMITAPKTHVVEMMIIKGPVECLQSAINISDVVIH